jgi:hypothetical protein
MIRVFSFVFLLLAATGLSAQVQTQLIGDSVRIHGNTGTAELNLENSTDTVKGFLYNKGAGRTEFRHGLIRISDTLYLIGSDTLHLSGVGGSSNGKNVYYVSRKFNGIAAAVVSGNTLASVNSTNPSYLAQLAKAVPGSMVFSYPDPYSARNAALDAIAAGTITCAQVVVLEGNRYTIGSNDSTKNGSTDGLSPNNGSVADIGFDKTKLTADSSLSSLMKNKLDVFFSMGSALTYINSSYSIYCFFNDDTVAFKSGIYGLGSFYQVYGEVNNFIATFGRIGNRASYTDFHAHELVLQQWQGFFFTDFAVANVEIDNLIATDANVFSVGAGVLGVTPSTGNAANPPRMLYIKVKDCRFGKGQTPYPDSNDYWYFICLFPNTPIEGTLVKIDIGNLFMKSTNGFPLFYISNTSSLYGVRLTVNIDNFVQRDSHLAYAGHDGGLMGCYGTTVSVNNSITYNIKSADIDAPMLGMMNWSFNSLNKNNHFNINIADCQKNHSAFVGGIYNCTNILSRSGGEQLVFKITGNYRSFDSSALIYAANTWYSAPFANLYEFSGKYESSVPGFPIAHFYANTGRIMAFTDATLINDGITPCVLADSVCGGTDCNCCSDQNPIVIPVYFRNVHANSAASSNIQQFGDPIKVYADIPSFFN